MNALSDWNASFAANVSAIGQRIGDYLPNLLAALVVLLIGWAVARMLRSAVWQLGSGVGRVSTLLGMSLSDGVEQRGTSLARIAGQIAFWLVILLFATVAVNLLGLIIASAMVIAMVAAGLAGALVPIALARLGQDPAVASSIVLTTVTDITGFFAFLGIAAALLQATA